MRGSVFARTIAENSRNHSPFMAHTFILSDESVNAYGTRILTAGIDVSLFKRNPIMLWGHHRTYRGTKDEVLPIGKWENIRKEDNKLLADAVFDTDDPFAQSIKSKVEQGILSMCSIGINIVATSDDKTVIAMGQTRPTVVKSMIFEASICDIGANRNALKMYDEYGSALNLSQTDDNHLLPLLSLAEQINHTTNQTDSTMNLKELLARTLDLDAATSDEQLLAQLGDIKSENSTLRAKVSTYEQAEAAATEARLAAMVDAAITERRITADDRERYLGLARTNETDVQAILAKISPALDLTQETTSKTELTDPWTVRETEINKNKR